MEPKITITKNCSILQKKRDSLQALSCICNITKCDLKIYAALYRGREKTVRLHNVRALLPANNIKNLAQTSFPNRAVKTFSVSPHFFRGTILNIRKSFRWGTSDSMKPIKCDYVIQTKNTYCSSFP